MRQVRYTQSKKITHDDFKKYGTVLTGLDVQDVIHQAAAYPIPAQGNEYIASLPALEQCIDPKIQHVIFGEVPIQVGICHGNGNTLDALEYHKSSEVFIAVTDVVLMLGWYQDIDAHTRFHTDRVDFFYVAKGEVVELLPLTLHFAPCKVKSEGFKSIIILPEHTNSVLTHSTPGYLFRQNKWLLSHATTTRFIEQHAPALLVGDTIEIIE